MNIKILVCYHKPSPIIANEVLQPILLGAQGANAEVKDELENLCKRAKTTLWYDNTGEHISELNPYFCELTAMYWAWKNLDADYYGLFHYRRVLDFKHKTQSLMPLKRKFKSLFIFFKKYGLNQKTISKTCQDADIILPQKVIDHDDYERAKDLSMYELYNEVHFIKDLDLCIELIATKYPSMKIALQKLHEKPQMWHIGNMFVMKKELYFEYCEWLFDILFTIQDSIPYRQYDAYQARVFGFLAERLFNVWITHKKDSVKITENPLIWFFPNKMFGWEVRDNIKRFYLFGIRVWKTHLGA